MTTGEAQPDYPPPPEREPGKNGIMIDKTWKSGRRGVKQPVVFPIHVKKENLSLH